MSDLLSILDTAIPTAFVLLTIAALAAWNRHRNSRRAYLTLAFGSLMTLILVSHALGGTSFVSQVLTDIEVVALLLSGYALVMFRDSFIPLGRVTRRAVTIVIMAVAALGLVAQLPADPHAQHGPFQGVALTAVLFTWALCVLEPTFRLWRSSLRRPAVEGARLRALSLGYLALVAEVLVATLAGELASNVTFMLVTNVVTLAIVPLLYVSFLPPGWLRWIWRQPEEDEFRKSLHDLLLYSPDRATLAQRALVWATRLVGGAGAFIVDSDGSILAARDMTAGRAAELAAGTNAGPPVGRSRIPSWHASKLVIPLSLQQGDGSMVIVAGPFTPVFGDDEVIRLRQYASSIAAGLDRVSLTQRIASLEKAKTEFLNVASHELRGPMTVIKGYLTMLESGSLGDLSPRSMAVLPLLIAKSDEVNWMVEQMVEAARLEDGRLALKKQIADVVELTERAIEGIRALLTNHELKLEKPSRAIPAEVDPDRIQIVVRNLLGNAAKYSPAGSRITVRVSRNGVAEIAVTDEGVGIAIEDQARLFTRFVRIEKQSTQHISGTGLGLWLSREIARMHDGDLTVESTPGFGSTFTLQLPLNQ
jgi:signal transduction histidine kinase